MRARRRASGRRRLPGARWGRRLAVYGSLMVVTVSAGLLMRFGRLGLPAPVVKYGGSTMWALMIYWVLAVTFRRWTAVRLGIAAGVIAAAVEFLKLYRAPWLDAFRLTLPGILLLGRYFSWADIAAYGVAIAFGVSVDHWLLGREGVARRA